MKICREREEWIDVAKAIGIILVVLAHAIPKDYFLWKFINNFGSITNFVG